jgi:flagellar motor switch/type III secretory pathway protein FliN
MSESNPVIQGLLDSLLAARLARPAGLIRRRQDPDNRQSMTVRRRSILLLRRGMGMANNLLASIPMARPDILLDQLADIPVSLEVDLGACRIPLRNLLDLKPGMELVLESPKQNGSGILAGNVRIGSGEVMNLDNCLVVRLETLEAAAGLESSPSDEKELPNG